MPSRASIVAARCLGFAAACAVPLATFAATITAGEIPGRFAVSDSGAATYQVPIAVPPGIAGMAPQLSLGYNGQGGNGLAGLGWSLEGLSTIQRCPRTPAQDGVRGGVNFDGNDRFCLDGQRLVRVAGMEGAAGAEYRTERDSFSRIVAVGAAGAGPASFTMQTKAGLTLHFGVTTDARLEVAGVATVRTWAVNRITDVAGNTMTIAYGKDAANAVLVPARIEYAGASVRFAYEARPDDAPAYLAGRMARATLRLTEVTTFIGESAHLRYRLSYLPHSVAEAPSRLARITLLHLASDTELPATELVWSAASPGFGGGMWAGHGGGTANNIVGDFDGDGRSDLAGYAGNGQWHVVLSTGYGFSNAGLWNGHTAGVGEGITGDFNGDGRTDIAAHMSDRPGQWHVCLSTGTNFSCGTWGGHADGLRNNVVADFDGDGRSDLAAHVGGSVWKVCLSNGATFICTDWGGGHAGGVGRNVVGDFNGDGRSDLAGYADNGFWHVTLSTGSGFAGTGAQWQGHSGGISDNVVGDFNGDGLTDLAGFTDRNGEWHVCLSTGVRFECGLWGGHGAGATNNVAADFNGDGRTDIAAYTGGNGLWHVCLSHGRNFRCDFLHNGHTAGGGSSFVGDFDGDGQQDMGAFASGDRWHIVLASPVRHTLLSIREGSGRVLSIGEASLSQPGSGYARQGPSAYPRVDLQRPVHVVRRVEQSDGVGGTNAQTYAYAGLKAELATGRGLLGFAEMSVTDAQSGLVSWRRFSQDWPHTGQVVASETRTSGALVLKRTESTYAQTPGSGPGTVFSFLFQAVESGRDLDGSVLPTITTRYEYAGAPQYGDPTRVEVVVSDGSGKVTANEYWPPATTDGKWILGRLKKATVTSVSSGAVPQLQAPVASGSPPSMPLPGPTPASGTKFTKLGPALAVLLD